MISSKDRMNADERRVSLTARLEILERTEADLQTKFLELLNLRESCKGARPSKYTPLRPEASERRPPARSHGPFAHRRSQLA
jgi:hypothetical protein